MARDAATDRKPDPQTLTVTTCPGKEAHLFRWVRTLQIPALNRAFGLHEAAIITLQRCLLVAPAEPALDAFAVTMAARDTRVTLHQRRGPYAYRLITLQPRDHQRPRQELPALLRDLGHPLAEAAPRPDPHHSVDLPVLPLLRDDPKDVLKLPAGAWDAPPPWKDHVLQRWRRHERKREAELQRAALDSLQAGPRRPGPGAVPGHLAADRSFVLTLRDVQLGYFEYLAYPRDHRSRRLAVLGWEDAAAGQQRGWYQVVHLWEPSVSDDDHVVLGDSTHLATLEPRKPGDACRVRQLADVALVIAMQPRPSTERWEACEPPPCS